MKDIEHTPASEASWNVFKQWGNDVDRIEKLVGGVANDVWSVCGLMGSSQLLASVPGVTLISRGRPSFSNTLTVRV